MITLHDLFSKQVLQATLESCNWQLHDYDGEAHEFWKIPHDNPILSVILNTLPRVIGQYGDYFYVKEKSLIKRTSNLIVPKTFKNNKFRVEIVKGVTPL
jgi:hypothetical protein